MLHLCRGVVFCLVRPAAARDPPAAAPYCKHESRSNECVIGEREPAKCTDVSAVQRCLSAAVVPRSHLQSSAFGTKL